MSASLDALTLFDRINLAHCAMKRAEHYVCNEQRFLSEYETTRMWDKYRCVITKTFSYVDK